MIIVTGGAGFIGANFIREWLKYENEAITTLDKLTYAGNMENLADVIDNPHHAFIHGDIADKKIVTKLIERCRPRAIINFAAETHVDRSIVEPTPFLKTNVEGTCTLLDAALAYWRQLSPSEQTNFRFIQISTDEVFGSLGKNDPSATEENPYLPNSPYAASKAAADHYVRAYHHTYGLPTIITHCTNNFGPYQFPEKLIPLMILNTLQDKPLPIYGDGQNIRNWLYVDDHCEALRLVLARGVASQVYNIAGEDSLTNIDLVKLLCAILDKKLARKTPSYNNIRFIEDRPGHDRRYSLDITKIKNELGWTPKGSFKEKLEKTIEWYLENERWLTHVQTGEYRQWIEKHYHS